MTDSFRKFNIRRDHEMSLSDLPNELLLHLVSFLNWSSLKRVRVSSRLFFELIPKDKLTGYHATQSSILHEQELLLLKEKTQFYWEEAEESFLGYHSSSYTSSSLDPDLRAESEKYKCLHHELPCYRCLQWKCSFSDSPAFEKSSAFSRSMITQSRNLGCSKSSTRTCIDCGIRSGFYKRRISLKSSLRCYSCGDLIDCTPWRWHFDETRPWQPRWLCTPCCTDPKYSEITLEQFMHELRWEKYEAAMTAGKAYRLEKGRMLRNKETTDPPSGKIERASKDRVVLHNYEKPRFCPVMQERRFCKCAAGKQLRCRSDWTQWRLRMMYEC